VEGFIQQSSLPITAHVQYAKYADGGLHFCIDYQGINSKTIYNQYLLPIESALNFICNMKIYSKLDIRGVYSS